MKLNENRMFKKDARAFKTWLADYMRRFGEFEPIMQAGFAQPAKDSAKVSVDKAKPAKADTRKPKTVAAVSNVNKVPNSHFTQGKKACFKCLSQDHNVFKCPKVAEGEAKLLMERARAIWASEARNISVVERVAAPVQPTLEAAISCAARVVCTASQTIPLDASFDSGADQSVIPPATIKMLQAAGRDVVVTDLPAPVVVRGFVGPSHTVTQEVKIDLKFETDAGPLMLTNVKCWLSVGSLPAGVDDLLLSRAIVCKRDYDPHSMLREAAAVCSEYDMSDVESPSGVVKAVLLATQQEFIDDLADEEEPLMPMELAVCFSGMALVDPAAEHAKVQLILDAKVVEASEAGCGAEFASGLAELLTKYVDVFRLTLGRDPPVDMPPLKVHLVPTAKPVRCKARRYSLPQREFMQKHVEELASAGFIYRNPASRWACAPLIVRKPHTKDEFRMIVDLRPANSQTEQIAWPMPMLDVVVDHLRGATCFFLLDFFKGYWQFSLDPSCQEIFSFLTDTGVFTSNRVMQGGSDSVAYCQSTVQAMFAGQLYRCLLAWLDDLFGYETSPAGLLRALAEVLEVCAVALQLLPSPRTGGDLQQYVCALNWMRMPIPGFNVLVRDLSAVLERVFAAVGGKRIKQLAESHVAAVEATKKALTNLVELSHPKPDMRLCMFAYASEEHWGRRAPHVFEWHLCWGRWSIVEKEAYAIVETLVLLLMGYDYEIHDIPGESNVWADLLSRWGSPLKSICAITSEPLLVSPLRSNSFKWPTLAAIALAQRGSLANNPTPPDPAVVCELSDQDQHRVVLDDGEPWMLRLVDGVLWIPDDATGLQLRLCVCAHASLAGHRPAGQTLASLAKFCRWSTLKADVKFFVGRCLHCASVLGGAPRPLGEALHSSQPNGLLHWNFVYMGDLKTGDRYLLVIKCDASRMVWLFPTKESTAVFVKQCLLQWFAVFGICYEWVSDQGTHFKNQVIAELQHVLGAHHHFITARCPWANGTVEVVMRMLLKLFRACLSEWRMATTQWSEIHLVVMLILNQLPSPSLGNVAPVTAMSGRPAMSPLDTIALPGLTKSATLEVINESQRDNIDKARAALNAMHKVVAETNAKKRAQARKSHDAKRGVQMAQFVVGDYVLYQDVWMHKRAKLRTTWCGPAVVTNVASNWVYDVRNLVTGEQRPAHAIRLKFYADEDLQLSEDFIDHVAHNSEGHEVEVIVSARYVPATKSYEVQIKWRGLRDVENSWEPAQNIQEDVPTMFKAFCKKRAKLAIVKKMAKAHEVD
ncbi:hypothetical protein H310_09756 [Aphanomyces invadans]|uniref:Integrase catalytic domain-containing protein n=1 Tax=Aphanomyces invadans TaxID=157072 RepID=A0A024TUZ8_9STRA|nr:hypothetical protein H310_09756 [Aphanomyces invadans]ETV97426.1 hypothetical protein H310_09756 [Aphanomyces invadans]|eukprot:XP_008874134.1 hypothetical protein H310_09756 [Aphanomyces invadans]